MKRFTLTLFLSLLATTTSLLAQSFSPDGVWISNEGEDYTFTVSGQQVEMRRDYAPARRYLGELDSKSMTLVARLDNVQDMGNQAPEDIRQKILAQRGDWPMRIDLTVVDDDNMNLLVYYNQVRWDPGTREITSLTVDAGTVPITLKRAKSWRWKPGGEEVTSKVRFRTTERAVIEEESATGNGHYAVDGAALMFQELMELYDLLDAVKKLHGLAKDGGSALNGDLDPGKKTLQTEAVGKLAEKAGLSMPPSNVIGVVEAYAKMEAAVADKILKKADEFRQELADRGLDLRGRLDLELIEWTCAEVEVRRGGNWVDGGYRMKSGPKLLKTWTRYQPFENILGKKYSGRDINIAQGKLRTWALQNRENPAKRAKVLEGKPCEVRGLCQHN